MKKPKPTYWKVCRAYTAPDGSSVCKSAYCLGNGYRLNETPHWVLEYRPGITTKPFYKGSHIYAFKTKEDAERFKVNNAVPDSIIIQGHGKVAREPLNFTCCSSRLIKTFWRQKTKLRYRYPVVTPAPQGTIELTEFTPL